jgi:hypothetical protein
MFYLVTLIIRLMIPCAAMSCLLLKVRNLSVPIPGGRFLLAFRFRIHSSGMSRPSSPSLVTQHHLAWRNVGVAPSPDSLCGWKPNMKLAPITAVVLSAALVACMDLTFQLKCWSSSHDHL